MKPGQWRAEATLEADVATRVSRDGRLASAIPPDLVFAPDAVFIDAPALFASASEVVAREAAVWERWAEQTTLNLLGFGTGALEARILSLRVRQSRAGDRSPNRDDDARRVIASLIALEMSELLEGFQVGTPHGLPDTKLFRLTRLRPLTEQWVTTSRPEFYLELPPRRTTVRMIVQFALEQLGRLFDGTAVSPHDWLPPDDTTSSSLPETSWAEVRAIVLRCEEPFSTRWAPFLALRER